MNTHKQTGMTLIELMVALAIGAFLMIGAITVFMQSRTTFRLTESVARLQENARFALDYLESDVRMAHYWGLTSITTSVDNRVAAAAGNVFGKDPCAANAARVLDVAVGGSNNNYQFSCMAWGIAELNADTLVVRRASEDPEVGALAGAATLRLQSARSPSLSLIFAGTTIPGLMNPATSQTHRLLMNGYYIDRQSSLGAVPSLRVKTLLADGTVQDQEVVAGVEDMQIQLGIDTDVPDGDDRGSIDRYVDIDDPMIDPSNGAFNPDARVLGVRLWLRVRAERAENGFTDTANYIYADQNVGPFNDAFRRVVVSKTIYLRNARPTPGT
jgi:prepilin-type N-terminal cleavage/methylation domain-containing protein